MDVLALELLPQGKREKMRNSVMETYHKWEILSALAAQPTSSNNK